MTISPGVFRFVLLSMTLLATACVQSTAPIRTSAGQVATKPNIIFILADDLGYGELGSYGQKTIQTPQLDKLAAEGMRFTQFYAGNTVCAPSRSVLMTGQHMGHTTVRGNAAEGAASGYASQTLRADDTTVATVLKKAGYATALIGKWGLGEFGSTGDPLKHGFDYMYGFVNQTHAHNHFPSFLWRNGERVLLPNDLTQLGKVEGTGYATKRVAYANDLFFDEARDFITRSEAQPFFLYLALTVPHANNERSRALGDGQEVPDYGIYKDKPWTDAQKGQAAMITRMDTHIGEIMAQLKKLGLDENTLVLFSSDNGPHKEGGPHYDPATFGASGPLTGIKRNLTDGGIRVPMIARWPGRVAAGKVSSHVGYFGDLMNTFAEFAGGKTPAPQTLDSVSIVPELLGKGKQTKHDYLYWEFYEKGFAQAVLLEGHWKGLRLQPTAPLELYDLTTDLAEKTNVAEKNPKVAARIAEIMTTAHVDNEHWKRPGK